jgi:UDP-N-acetylglucosamine 2-epimerase
VIIAVDQVLAELQPDAVLVLGDTNSCLAVIPAKRRKIPTFHMEAGNRCFDMRVPEEINRRIVDHTADINLTYSDIAREYLLPKACRRTGHQDRQPDVRGAGALRAEDRRLRCARAVGAAARWLLRGQRAPRGEHRVRPELRRAGGDAQRGGEDHGMPVVVSTHPRTQAHRCDGHRVRRARAACSSRLGFSDYVRLQKDAKAVLSDSGTINEEASILNFRALNLREAHERPEGMEEAAVMMVGMNVDA